MEGPGHRQPSGDRHEQRGVHRHALADVADRQHHLPHHRVQPADEEDEREEAEAVADRQVFEEEGGGVVGSVALPDPQRQQVQRHANQRQGDQTCLLHQLPHLRYGAGPVVGGRGGRRCPASLRGEGRVVGVSGRCCGSCDNSISCGPVFGYGGIVVAAAVVVVGVFLDGIVEKSGGFSVNARVSSDYVTSKSGW